MGLLKKGRHIPARMLVRDLQAGGLVQVTCPVCDTCYWVDRDFVKAGAYLCEGRGDYIFVHGPGSEALYPMDDSVTGFSGLKPDEPFGFTLSLQADQQVPLAEVHALFEGMIKRERETIYKHQLELAAMERWLYEHPLGGDDNAG